MSFEEISVQEGNQSEIGKIIIVKNKRQHIFPKLHKTLFATICQNSSERTCKKQEILTTSRGQNWMAGDNTQRETIMSCIFKFCTTGMGSLL